MLKTKFKQKSSRNITLTKAVLSAALLLAACTQQRSQIADNNPSSKVISQQAAELSETSGLVCLGNHQFISINDSGNPPDLHLVDAAGNALKTIKTGIKPIDLEAITTDGKRLWLGDIGNNSGGRISLSVYEFSAAENHDYVFTNRHIEMFFAETPTFIEAYQHDRDAEALAYKDQALYLFSKSWATNVSQVYKISLDLQQQQLEAIAQIHDLPGLITDAVYVPQAKVFLLTGYQNVHQHLWQFAISGNYHAFVAVLNQHFQLQGSYALAQAGQVEGICVDEAEQVWLSQEAARGKPARIWTEFNLRQLMSSITQA